MHHADVVGTSEQKLHNMSHPELRKRIRGLIRETGIEPKRVLEIGGYVDKRSLMRFPELRSADRWCINLVDQPRGTGINHVIGNSNHMPMFEDASFDLVMSCAVHEHDKHFWRSIAEMQRVLKPGGLMIIAVPGFATLPTDVGNTTTTYRVHYYVDYYRFTKRAVREVFFDGMERVRVVHLLEPPRILGHGYKPV